MSRIILVGLFFLFVRASLAQTIQLLNEENNEPVFGAIIFTEDKSVFATSDETGFVDIGQFNSCTQLVIQHPSFHVLKIYLSEIEASGSIVYLKEKVIRIDEIVISANRWEQNKSEIPFEIMSLDAKEMSFRNPQTSADMLEASGQVFVQKSQLGGGSPMIRGFGANSVLIVVDGVRMNNTIFRSGNLQNVINIDPNALESSEVIFGPGAVIYGSDALGGVMDFHTISPSFSKDGKVWIDGHAMTRYSTANNEKTASALITIGKNKFGYVGSLTFSDFDDLKTGSIRPSTQPDFGKRPEYVSIINGLDTIVENSDVNLQRFSGYKQLNTLQKFALRVNDHLDIGYTFNFSTTTDIPRYDRLIEYSGEDLKYAQWFYGPQKWMMNALKVSYFKSNVLFDAAKLTASYQTFQESRHDRKFEQAALYNRKEKVNLVTLNTDFEKMIDMKSDLFYGLEYTFNHVSSSAYTQNIETDEISSLSTRYPDGGSDVHSFAIYGSYKWNLAEKFFLSTGFRFTHQNLFSNFNENAFFFSDINNNSSAVNGNIGLVYKPDARWNISGLLSSGFRAPNVDDISKVFDSEPGNVVVPNPDLKPEYSYNAELSATRYFETNVILSGTVFYSFLRDAMVKGDFMVNGQDSIMYDAELSRVQAIINTGRANIYGFNMTLQMEFSSRWFGSASLNYTEGRDLIADEPLRHTTPLFGLLSVVYTRNKFKGEFYTRFNGKRSFENLPPSERNKPHLYSSDGSLGWYTLNLRGNYQFNEIIGINVALENILDQHYRTYSSGISAPGRNFILSVKANL